MGIETNHQIIIILCSSVRVHGVVQGTKIGQVVLQRVYNQMTLNEIGPLWL